MGVGRSGGGVYRGTKHREGIVKLKPLNFKHPQIESATYPDAKFCIDADGTTLRFQWVFGVVNFARHQKAEGFLVEAASVAVAHFWLASGLDVRG